jgi:shikimate dehydrogenase
MASERGDAVPSRRAAVLGLPVVHSLSPALHTAAYRALGLDDWSYDRYECAETDLAGFVAGLGPEWVGLSLTMPLKRVALEVADEVDAFAAAVGAANTLVLGPRRVAYNTDVAGIVASLGPVTGSAVVLGAGGTAQAALAALRELGIADVTVLVRDLDRTAQLRATAERLGVTPRIDGALAEPERAAALVSEAAVVISTLPGGAPDVLGGKASFRPGAVVLDVVYSPWPTPLATAAMSGGARVVSGLDVLLHQAVAQVELMTGRRGPVEAMRSALTAAAADRA